MPLIILAVGILFLFFLIVKVRLNSFLALLLVAGLQFFSFGLLGELIVKQNHRRNYDETRIRDRF